MKSGYSKQEFEVHFSKFKQLRETTMLTIREVGKEVGISQPTAYKYEKIRLGRTKYGDGNKTHKWIPKSARPSLIDRVIKDITGDNIDAGDSTVESPSELMGVLKGISDKLDTIINMFQKDASNTNTRGIHGLVSSRG